jgi:hypothetical protein
MYIFSCNDKQKKKIKMLKQILLFVFLLKYSLVCMEICHIYRNECHDTNYHKTKCLNVKCQGLTRYIVVLYINNLKSRAPCTIYLNRI